MDDRRHPHFHAAGVPPELTDLDDASTAVFRAFGTAVRLHRQFMTRRMGESAVHPGQAVCLNILARRDGVPQRDLAETMHVAPPTLSRMLRSMERAGLVERRADEADQRLTRVYLSDAGRVLAARARAALADHIPAAMAALSREERVELARLLEKLNASVALSLGADPETDGRAGEADRAAPDAGAAG
jgi:DNA-binding MarR family transcriptional regulator